MGSERTARTDVPPRVVLVDSGLGVPRRRDGLMVGGGRLTRAKAGTGQGGDRLRGVGLGGGVVRHAGVGCAGIWQILPAFIARHLWRTWRVVEHTLTGAGPAPETRETRRW